jgi:hypothetical protein
MSIAQIADRWGAGEGRTSWQGPFRVGGPHHGPAREARGAWSHARIGYFSSCGLWLGVSAALAWVLIALGIPEPLRPAFATAAFLGAWILCCLVAAHHPSTWNVLGSATAITASIGAVVLSVLSSPANAADPVITTKAAAEQRRRRPTPPSISLTRTCGSRDAKLIGSRASCPRKAPASITLTDPLPAFDSRAGNAAKRLPLGPHALVRLARSLPRD